MEIAEEQQPCRTNPLDLSALESVLGGPLLGPDGNVDPAVLDRFSDRHIYAGLLAGIAARLIQRMRLSDKLEVERASGRAFKIRQACDRIDRQTAKLHRDAAVFIQTLELLNAAGAGR